MGFHYILNPPRKAIVYALMVPSWADQLLPQLLMEQFDTIDTLNICMKEFGSEIFF